MQLGLRSRIYSRARHYRRGAVAALARRGLFVDVNSERIERLRNAHKGARAVVIGNGPSLRIADLTTLRSEITFGANKIYLAFDQTQWRPSYYNVEDALVIKQNVEQIQALHGFTKLLNRSQPTPLADDDWTIFYDLVVLPPDRFPGFSEDPHRGLCCGYSVCLSSMQWAWFMGVNEIFLIGVDFDFAVGTTESNGVLTSVGESNHFVPNYRTAGERWFPPRLKEQLEAFTFAREWLLARGVRVYNATRGGKLEVFPRVDFDTVFPSSGRE